jgi:hypothetical protein
LEAAASIERSASCCGTGKELASGAEPAPRRVLKTKTFYVIAEFRKGSRSKSAGETAPHDDNVKFPLVVGINEL